MRGIEFFKRMHSNGTPINQWVVASYHHPAPSMNAQEAGWMLVPVEPTEDMFINGMEADCCGRPSVDDETHVRSIWSAMLEAAPKVGGV